MISDKLIINELNKFTDVDTVGMTPNTITTHEVFKGKDYFGWEYK